VELGNKRRHSKLVIHFKGTPLNPMTGAEVEDKARKLSRGILSERRLERLVDSMANLEKIADVSTISELLRIA
jgi:2-methylcitrate dehydratase PrpD